MKFPPRNRLRRRFLHFFIALVAGVSALQAQDTITFFGEEGSGAPGSISDKLIGGEDFTILTEASGGEVIVSIQSILPTTRGGLAVEPIFLVDDSVSISTDLDDTAEVTLLAELFDGGGGLVDQETRTFTVRRTQTLSFVNLPEVDLGDPSFSVTVGADPNEGQSLGFSIIDGPGQIDPTTGRVNVYGTGAILLQAFGGETNYTGSEADLLQATTLNRTLVVGGDEPTGGPGFLDLWTWRSPQLSLTDYLYEVTVNETQTQFVAVGASGLVIQGSDPADSSTWTEPATGTTEYLLGVTFGNNRYVAVGNNESVITSLDGITWIDGSAGLDPGVNLRSVDYSGDSNEFVAAGTNVSGRSVLYISSDGLNWVADGSFPLSIFAPNAIFYSDSLGTWQVIGHAGSWFVGAPGSWMVNTAGFDENYNDGLTTPEGVTYIVGDGGTILRTQAGSTMIWTTVNSGANYDLESIAANDRYLVASGENGRLLRSNSDNGNRWVESITPFRFDIQGLAFFDGLLVGVGQNESVATSGSGFDWTLRDSISPETIRAVASNGSTAVAVGGDGNVFRSINNGETWSQPGTAIIEDLRDVIFAEGNFITVGTNGAIYRSPDGATWTAASSISGLFGPSFSGDLNGIHYNGVSYAAVGDDLVILYSPDGDIWTQGTAGIVDLNDITSKAGKFMVVGDQGKVFYSANGINWSQGSSGVAEDLYSVTASDSEYLAVGEDGILLTSPNGSTWTTRISAVTQDLAATLYFDDSFYAFGEGFALLVSDNSGDWESQVAPTQNAIYGATVAGDWIIAVTDFGGILTSPIAGSTGLEDWTFRYSGEIGDDINDVILVSI
jgi:hypothetical protein